jgi:hypothetical protein
VTSSAGSDRWQNFGVFYNSGSLTDEQVALRIDEAFANRLTLKDKGQDANCNGKDSAFLIPAYTFSPWDHGRQTVKSFSKYNVGLVYYYYDLWGFNYFIALAGISALFTLLTSIVFGLIKRLIYCLALFMIYSPILGMSPLDGGKAFGSWKTEFIKNVLMAHGSVVGINIFFLILPFLKNISFFNNIFLDGIMNMLIVIAGLATVKDFIKIVSGYIGSSSAADEGSTLKGDVLKLGANSASKMMGAAQVGVGIGSLAYKFAKGSVDMASSENKDGKKNSGFKKIVGHVGMGLSGVMLLPALISKGINKGADAKIKNTFGMAKTDKLSDDDRKKYAQYQKLKKLKNVDGGELDTAFKKGADGKFDESKIDAIIAKNNQLVNDKRKADGESEMNAGADGIVDASVAPKVSGALSSFGKGLLDLTGSTIKLATDLTGIQTLKKSLEEAGAIDEAKTAIFRFGQAIGAIKDDKTPDWAKTKKIKEGAEKDSSKAVQTAQTAIASDTSKILQAIKDLTNKLDDSKKK